MKQSSSQTDNGGRGGLVRSCADIVAARGAPKAPTTPIPPTAQSIVSPDHAPLQPMEPSREFLQDELPGARVSEEISNEDEPAGASSSQLGQNKPMRLHPEVDDFIPSIMRQGYESPIGDQTASEMRHANLARPRRLEDAQLTLRIDADGLQLEKADKGSEVIVQFPDSLLFRTGSAGLSSFKGYFSTFDAERHIQDQQKGMVDLNHRVEKMKIKLESLDREVRGLIKRLPKDVDPEK